MRRLRNAPPACAVCGRLLDERGRCRRCATDAARQRLLAGWLYEPPCDSVLKALKFRGLDYLGAALGRELAARFPALRQDHDAVVAVPLHWRRRWRRGYNQAELIARSLATELELPLVDGLRRRRATRRQTSLDRDARLVALRQAFVTTRPSSRFAAARVVLVDDVFTTGATLAAAAEALILGGAGAVTGVVAARVETRP